MFLLMFAAMQLLFQVLLTIVAIFLILLVLVQRGRGGGLAGALGGMGGSSAFGAKAGDVFTRITVIAAAVWILLCIAAAKLGPTGSGSRVNVEGEVPASISTEEHADGPAATTDDKATADESDEASPTTGNDSASQASGGNASGAESEDAGTENKTE